MAQKVPPQSNQNNPSLYILAVDDEPLVLRSLEAILEDWGYSVLCAQSLSETRDLLLANGPPTAVVTDYHLRGKETGAMVLEEIRKMFGPGTPALVMTAHASPSKVRKDVGNDVPVLEMPVDPKHLKRLLVDLCQRKEGQDFGA